MIWNVIEKSAIEMFSQEVFSVAGKIHSISIASYKERCGEQVLHDVLHKGRKSMMRLTEDKNYTYVLRCADDSLYTGWTNNLEKRIEMHNSGRGAKYTRGRGPVELIYCEAFATKEEAMRREWEIKQLTRKEKEELIKKTCHS